MRTYEGAGRRGLHPLRIHAKSLTRDLKKKTNGGWRAGRPIEMEMPIVPIGARSRCTARRFDTTFLMISTNVNSFFKIMLNRIGKRQSSRL